MFEGGDVPALLNRTVVAIQRSLKADLVAALMISPERDSLLLAGGVGWKPGVVGTTLLPPPSGETSSPMMIPDVLKDARCPARDLLLDHAARSGVVARIESPRGFFGFLGAFIRETNPFRLDDGSFLAAASSDLADAIALRREESELRRRRDALELDVRSLKVEAKRRTALLGLIQDITRASNETECLDEATQFALQRIGTGNGLASGNAYRLLREDGEVLVPVQSWTARGPSSLDWLPLVEGNHRFRKGEDLPGRVLEFGEPVFVQDLETEMVPDRAAAARDAGAKTALAFPVKIGTQTVAVLEFFSERRIEPEAALLSLFNHAGAQLGHVAERVRYREVLTEAIVSQQQRIAQELHDGVGQELTGLALMCQALILGSAGRKTAMETSGRIAEGIRRASDRIGTLARGLFPLEVEPSGLLPALERLAERASRLHGIAIRFVEEGGIEVSDRRVATQIFRIVQEAVSNAARHAQAREVTIQLRMKESLLTIEVKDDGVGTTTRRREGRGLGLRIMRNRAASIGATLSIESVRKSGTRVVCSVPMTRVAISSAEADARCRLREGKA